jgi:hypothetical protein
MDKVLDLVIGRAARAGLRGNFLFLGVAGGAWLWRRSRAKRSPSPVWTQDLEPGQAVVVTHHPR